MTDGNQGSNQRWDHPKREDQSTANKQDNVEEKVSDNFQSDRPREVREQSENTNRGHAHNPFPNRDRGLFNDFQSAQNALLVLNPLDRDTVKNAEYHNRWHVVPAEVDKRICRNQQRD